MNKYEYRHYTRKGETKLNLPDNVAALQKKVKSIGRAVGKKSKDTGWKGGVKSTSHQYNADRLAWSGWHADCESMFTLSVDGQPVARTYDCHGQGWFEFLNEKTINKIFNQVFPEHGADA